jgi:hypothetical protein
LPYAPFLVVDNCDDQGHNCVATGLLADLQDVICQMLNCTWETHVPAKNGWGVSPISGPFNKSGVWGGVMGGVVNGDYMIIHSSWVWNFERYELLDFVSTGFDQVVLVLTPKPPEVDIGLFIRPFTDDAWRGIGITFLIILLVIMIPYASIHYFEFTNG